LKLLEAFPSEGTPNADYVDSPMNESGKGLLRRVGVLAGELREARDKLGRMEKELAAYRDVNVDTNRMLEKKIEEISLLRLITDITNRAIMTEDPFKEILDQVIAIVGAENGSILLYNTEIGGLEIHTRSGGMPFEPDDRLFELMKQIVDNVAASGKPYFVADTRNDPHFALCSEGKSGVGSLAMFPLIAEGKTVGVLTMSSSCRNAFGIDTERIIHIIAGQIAVAIQNVRLYGEVRKTKDYLENLVEWAGDAIFTLDLDHRIVSWNTGAKVIFGRDKESVLGKTVFSLAPNGASSLRENIATVLAFENIVTVETPIMKEDDQEIQIALTLSPIHGANGKVVGVSGIAKDITERKRIEEELRGLDEAKSYFVSIVSHELRTPLTSIKSLTEVLLHDEMRRISEETVGRYLTIINEECDRLSGLISGLLDMQKLKTGKLDVKFVPVPLVEVVKQAMDLFDVVAFQNSIDLKAEVLAPDAATAVMGDRERLMQILSNLLSNALKYAGAGGNILIRLAREAEDVKLTVTDNGIGIPNGEKDRVFEKFYQVDNPITRHKGGTGLGLAITKELVVLHGGQIWVESGSNGGCSFQVVMPAA